MTMEGDDWRNAKCSCPIFMKKYICKHIVGMAILKNLVEVPDEAKTVPLGQKRKRGRPARVTKAILI